MTIKEQFFKRYEIPYLKQCRRTYCTDQECRDCVRSSYPSITPDIILALEEIILEKFTEITYLKWQPRNRTEYRCYTDEGSNRDMTGNYKADRISALLSLFLHLPEDIIEQLKPQVQAVFKENN